MMHTVSDLLVGLLVTALGLVGLVLAAGAIDDEIYVFGFGLILFSVAFNFGLVKAHFDRQDLAKAHAV